ncbi:NAD(+) diphosphatase [Nakamurella sp. YIM 132087]|uniref:NAD(+) diphosphatase n=1 Tax=Nakamurella alba TaxID=2665158 RepID=A0A7K1FGK3_9ACTN|nr:NAD(+) diphosphatase [Nakamurella alba]MTD13190.1 NAD(+) diphosphatase [Nakamurella alba]
MTGLPGWFPIEVPLLSRGTADRSEDLRDADRSRAGWATASVLVVDDKGRVGTVTTGDGRVELALLPAAGLGEVPPAGAVLLGRVTRAGTEGAHDVWALSGDLDDTVADGAAGLRELGAALDDTDAGLLTAAVSVLGWHRAGRFCPRCGEPSEPRSAGWSRHCPNGHEEFPRTDPAVIVLVHDGADRMVLARQPIWPAGRYSVLAGFVEGGESLEATVLREIEEEVGLVVEDITYLGSQPWPFPRSLMLGFSARADPGDPLRPRDGEIEEAMWVDRATVRAALAGGDDWTAPDDPRATGPGILLPGEVSIARRMIEGWAALDTP